jgi:3-oxoisoapionate kinase
MNDLLLTYYGDDFTGSTDVMEALTLGGVPTALFLDPPTPEQLAAFPALRGLGVAGISRTLSPARMDEELSPRFAALKALGAPVFHYKVCSTFDSSPEIGSIGRAIEIGSRIFDSPVVPLMVGSPALKRFVIFGNLFAQVADVTYRVDRHPTMSKHPVTPMHESDLRLHLGKQTTRSIGLIDILYLSENDEAVGARLKALIAAGHEIILLDTLDDEHVLKIGRLIWSQRGEKSVFVVGSSGVEYALTAHWQEIGETQKPPPLTSPGAVDQLIVMSGSAAPGTAAQIDYALKNGFEGIRLDVPRLLNPDSADAERECVITQALEVLGAGHSLVLYSACGPDDTAIQAAKGQLHQLGIDSHSVGHHLGTQQGEILRALLEKTGLRRACVAGGDTCSYAARQLGIYALEILTPISPGAPLCRARSSSTHFDGLQISLKGGQNGGPDYFNAIKQGQALSS